MGEGDHPPHCVTCVTRHETATGTGRCEVTEQTNYYVTVRHAASLLIPDDSTTFSGVMRIVPNMLIRVSGLGR